MCGRHHVAPIDMADFLMKWIDGLLIILGSCCFRAYVLGMMLCASKLFTIETPPITLLYLLVSCSTSYGVYVTVAGEGLIVSISVECHIGGRP